MVQNFMSSSSSLDLRFDSSMPLQQDAVNQFGNNVRGQLACFLNDLFQCHWHGAEHTRFKDATQCRAAASEMGSVPPMEPSNR
jgi:hypothetical protein